MTLVDVGVWLAAVWGRHVHYPAASGWLNEQEDDLAFCRVTQMGLLRLLSNPAIMGALADVRLHLRPVSDRPWPPAFFGSVTSKTPDVASRVDEILAEGFGRS